MNQTEGIDATSKIPRQLAGIVRYVVAAIGGLSDRISAL